MALYKLNKKLEYINEKPFLLEKEIQKLTEDNLESVFNLDFVKSEFQIKNFRIDTLAFDNESKSFVIIEYKRDKNYSVVDQGFTYLSLMLNNKSDFILEYNENKDTRIKRQDVDWTQSKVIFVSPSFTIHQKEAINFKDLPIELWEIKRYENNIVSYEQIERLSSSESIKTISKPNDTIDKVTKEIRVYTEEEHLKKALPEIKELYEKLKNSILTLGDFEIKPKKLYIAFVAGRNVVDIHIQKKSLKLWINLSKGELDDPKGIAKDVSSTGHWGNGDYEIQMKNDEQLEYILSLIKQSLNKNKK